MGGGQQMWIINSLEKILFPLAEVDKSGGGGDEGGIGLLLL